ncbi:MAG TPA: beta-ketoacyl-[acyl-carrier-protein] synthase II [Cytophagales bacterium]|jgi:3-oxoacyl-[acyl-carrier-protein] synthase II|nr:beta-ketoacyl-[acyl-carrier-protein] synthase II [Cytophagales bacterium]
MAFKRVVITGAGALTAIGNTLHEYWDGLKNGKSGAAPITKFDTTKFKTKFACEVKGFDPEKFMDRKEARKMDLFTQYAMAVVDEAIKNANLPLADLNLDRVGVIWGSGIGGLFTFQEEVISFAKGDGTPRFNPFFIPKMIPDLSAGHISIKYGFRGPNYVTVSACASSTNAIYDAYTYLKLGKADIIVSGGSEAAVCIAGVGGFNALKALSERNDTPETASRPYDKDRDGFVLGEGAGALILEEYEHAKKRGAKILGEIIGGGMSSDAYHITAPHPEGAGIIKVMEYALEEAGIKPEDVDYVNTHGTSTPLGDVGEIRAIQKVFGEHAYKMNISSTKSMTGHLLGAAGAVETIACLLAINESIVPPTINHFTDDPELDSKLNLTFNQAQQRKVNIALSNTFGFGGHNFSILIKKAE